MASYFYVITVLSIVHLPMRHNAKWLWPWAVGVPVICLMSETGRRFVRASRRRAALIAVRLSLGTGYGLGAYTVVLFVKEGFRHFPQR